ncbi:CPBP family intramembrane metalloprotease [Clostridium sp. OM05-9]|uniref:CPBP family intramembrane glutamic endopeptidase n=1 Tax=Clostridium sp. OM05-9 TaxID=2293045 RepID=UPI000E4AC021|nr:CPBP family intramembrane glutamic endopeptidase [Clostridium sp. OM05-9]RHV10417.1 CPBP family intramembrane metalloprotease [Clostridium sp. OM05-9]
MINTRVDLRKLVITCLVPVTALLIHNIVYLAGTRICDLTGSQTDSVGSITSCISYILCICIFGYFYLKYETIFGQAQADKTHSGRLSDKTKHAGKEKSFLRAFVIFLLILILGISLQFLTTCILRLIDICRPDLLSSYHEQVQRSFSINNGIIRICTVAILAPIAEEFAFRGTALKLSASAFSSRYADLYAILFTAFCFGFYHGNIVQFCYSVPAGIILGCLAVWSGSLIPGMILHMILNASSYVIGSIAISPSILWGIIGITCILIMICMKLIRRSI